MRGALLQPGQLRRPACAPRGLGSAHLLPARSSSAGGTRPRASCSGWGPLPSWQQQARQRRQRSCASQASCSGQQVAELAAAVRLPPPAVLLVLAGIALAVAVIKKVLDTPSRKYDPSNPNVGASYDAWEQDGILEYYWGEHIHLGYYSEAERAAGYKKKDFKQAKFDFIDEMLRWSGTPGPKRILDVGCGIGGTSRYLAQKFPGARVEGITLSPNQVRRAGELAAERGLTNVSFSVMDALNMTHGDDTFDLVWACESGEHMPDKTRYVQEMARVLKPGGHMVVATWCQREETPATPFTDKDRADLQFLYDEWTHPHFISKEEYARRMEATGKLEGVGVDDWTPQTLPTWRHSNWVGVWDPWIVVFKGPRVWYSVVREIVTIERMHRAFARGLMEYGMIRAVKKGGPGAPAAAAAGAVSAAAAQ